MVRKYKRETSAVNKEVLFTALNLIKEESRSVNSVARQYNVPEAILRRLNKSQNNRETRNLSANVLPTPGSFKKVFSEEQEKELVCYILACSDIYFGLTPKEVRKIAYEFAMSQQRKCPNSWDLAGSDWFGSFLKRHSNLSIRKPQATSLARASNFNRTNIGLFFDNLRTVLERMNISAKDIFNMDETGVTTVQTPNRIVSRKDVKQIRRITSAERGQFVTVAVAVSATGVQIPPFFIFPRVRFRNHFLQGGSPGCSGYANKYGWMKTENFTKFLNHCISNTNCSRERPVLLLLDNHESHLSIAAIDLCKENGITLLSFPAHCTHKLQPLDRSLFGPFKKAINSQCNLWITNNPGKCISIYNIPGIVAKALPVAATVSNIVAGFEVTGISPFNPEVFTELDFMPSISTNRLQSNASQLLITDQNMENTYEPGMFNSSVGPTTCSISDLRPLPQAGARSTPRGGRKKRTTEILMDSPVRDRLKFDVKRIEERRNNKSTNTNRSYNRNPKSTNNIIKKMSINKEPVASTSAGPDCNSGPSKKSRNRKRNKVIDLCNICYISLPNNYDDCIQCRMCKKYTHLECSQISLPNVYICIDCTDEDIE